MEKKYYLAVCDNFKLEAQALQDIDSFNKFDIIRFPARCGQPQLSLEEVEEMLASCEPTSAVHLLGGCCIARLSNDFKKFQHCTFHYFEQCFYMFCNNSYIDSLLQTGAYLASPGWLTNWQEHIKEWGFNRDNVQDFFEQSADRIVFLDTHVSSDSNSHARNFAEFVKRPLETIPIGLDFFELLVYKITAENEIHARQAECSILNKRSSDCMMTLDILAGLSGFTKQDKVIDAVIELFSMLFAPKKIQFYPLLKDNPKESSVLNRLNADVSAFWEKLNNDGFAWTEPGKSGFWILFKSEHLVFGLIKVDEVALPEYSRAYLNLALPIAKMCGLLVHNIITIAELKKAHKMEAIGVVAGGIAHDFNNILSAVIGFSDLAKDEIPESNPARRMVEKVLHAGNLAKDLIGHFLAVSDHDTKKPEPVSVVSLVDEVLDLLKSTSIATTINFQQDIDTEAGTILADPSQIHQVIMNLCVNAMYAMGKKGGTLEIALHGIELTDKNLKKLLRPTQNQPGSYVKLTVKDTGSGIDEAVLEKIFDPYFTTKKLSSEKGIGMGLAVVNGIVSKHNGFIKVDSEIGKGTSFYVYLPVMERNDDKLK